MARQLCGVAQHEGRFEFGTRRTGAVRFSEYEVLMASLAIVLNAH